jgi:multiple sugar transport system ATP-binding protein
VPVLELTNISKLFRGPTGETVTALQGISLALEAGELLTVVGPSGSGKTTLLRLIAGLDDPNSGTIALGGQSLSAVPAQKRDIAMVFQNGALYPHMTARENLAFGLKLRNVAAQEIARRVQETAQLLGLTDCLGRRPAALSGGQRQRVALGRAIVRRPGLFLLDEPLSNLDPQTRVELRMKIGRLHKETGITMIHVTHDHEEALTLGDRVAVLCAGRLQQIASPKEIYERPANRFVAGFVGSPPMNFVRGRLVVVGAGIEFYEAGPGSSGTGEAISVCLPDAVGARLRSRAGEDLVLGIRPEHLALVESDTPKGFPARLRGRVQFVQNLGSDWLVHIATAGHSLIARLPPCSRVRVNESVSLTMEPEQLLFFNPANGSAL